MIPKIESIMSKEFYSINAKWNVQQAAEKMSDLGIGSLLVEEDGHYVGMITEFDIVRKVIVERHFPNHIMVEEVMAAPLISIEARQSVIEADELMEENKLRHLVVKRDGDIIGVVSIRDFLHPLQIEEEIEIPMEKASGY